MNQRKDTIHESVKASDLPVSVFIPTREFSAILKTKKGNIHIHNENFQIKKKI